MALVGTNEYPEILALLDAQLTTKEVRKEVIEADVHLGRVEREVVARIPNAQALVTAAGEDGQRVKLIVKLLTAASLAPVLVRITSVSVQARDVTYARQVYDPETRAKELTDLAEREYAELEAGEDAAYEMPLMFGVASGSRGR